MSELVIKLVGFPGDGIISSGDILTLASAKSKVYMVNNEIIITLDLFNDATYYLSLDLNDNSQKIKKYPYFKLESGKHATKNNSYLYDSTLFQICFNDEVLGLNIHSVTNKNILQAILLLIQEA